MDRLAKCVDRPINSEERGVNLGVMLYASSSSLPKQQIVMDSGVQR